jgi:hypothetical protein
LNTPNAGGAGSRSAIIPPLAHQLSDRRHQAFLVL